MGIEKSIDNETVALFFTEFIEIDNALKSAGVDT